MKLKLKHEKGYTGIFIWDNGEIILDETRWLILPLNTKNRSPFYSIFPLHFKNKKQEKTNKS